MHGDWRQMRWQDLIDLVGVLCQDLGKFKSDLQLIVFETHLPGRRDYGFHLQREGELRGLVRGRGYDGEVRGQLVSRER